MAAKNSIKEYIPDSFYHIYNRGVEKRNIFLDEQDFAVFLSYLQTYLSPKDETGLRAIATSLDSSPQEKEKAQGLLKLKNYYGIIDLLCYSLLPNHFHILIYQNDANAIAHFLSSLGNRYATYFNHKYGRVGPLFQGVYRAVSVQSDEQLLHLSRYIHLNPYLWGNFPVKPSTVILWPSSLPAYLNLQNPTWVKPQIILNYFKRESPSQDYWKFLELYADPEPICNLTIDLDTD